MEIRCHARPALWLLFSLLLATASSTLSADGFEAFKQQRKQAFSQHQRSLEDEFAQFRRTYRKELERYVRELGRHWPDLEITNRSQWVDYSPDWQTRRVVDFANNEIRLQFKSSEARPDLSRQALQELEQLLDTSLQQAYADDKVLNRTLRRLRQPPPRLGDAGRDKVLSELGQTSAKRLLDKALIHTRTLGDPHKKRSVKSVTTVTVPLPKSRVQRKAKQYETWVNRYAQQAGLEPALVMAVIHTESHFNPLARSHIPAYGLMQIVPTSAGRDVARELYGQERLLSPNFLYQPENNIKVGTTYLNLLLNRYLSDINHPQSRLYCAIAAYNTGAGNVARAFNSGTSIREAATKINRLTPRQVYNQLYRRLPHQETRDYLRHVTSRQRLYVNL